MNYRYDVDKWLLHQLPLVFRRPKLYALIRCIAVALTHVYTTFWRYSNDVRRRLDNTSQVISLERWLNDVFFLDGDIQIKDYASDNVYLHFQGEIPEDIYIGYDSEDAAIYLSANNPGVLSGGFAVYVPAELATEDNLRIIRKWVEYYKMAGTEYKIVTYE